LDTDPEEASPMTTHTDVASPTTTMTATTAAATTVADTMRDTRETLSVSRLFGEPYLVDGLTIIPVARISGGAGGGGGEGKNAEESGGGFGTGFGLGARPVGVYEVRNGESTWKPVIDATMLMRRFQVLVGVVVVCVTLVTLRRGGRHHPAR
jgi:uncharacterized spore protein YtfJ